jgi:hypothetical protein
LWVICATPESVRGIRELGMQAGVEFHEWRRDAADPRKSYVICAQIGHELPFSPEDRIVGPHLVLVPDCLDALHMERQLLDRLQPMEIRHCVCIEDLYLRELLSLGVLRVSRWLSARFGLGEEHLARRLAGMVHSRAESARRRARRAWATAEEEVQRRRAFVGSFPA